MGSGDDPRSILKNMSVDEKEIPGDLDDAALWKLIASCVAEPPRRSKLESVTTYEDVVELVKKSSKIVVLTGAGVSVSCGIPDFRSRNGIYARLSVDYPDLPDPQAMFDIGYFKKNPKPFFKFAKEIYPGKFHPSLSHFFIGALEKSGKLLRNYTQNIDTLEPSAGISRVIQCHGSFSTATCMTCKHKVDAEAIREDVMRQVIPRCPLCPPDCEFNILKPDIVFFGESLPEEFQQFELDKDECDLLIVMGSSLIVRPVAIIPNVLPSHVPQVLINRENLPHMNFDVELLGDCDGIIQRLCKDLGEPFTEFMKTMQGGSSPANGSPETTSEAPEVCCSVTSNSEERSVLQPSKKKSGESANDEVQCDTTVEDAEASSRPDSSTQEDERAKREDSIEDGPSAAEGCSMSNDEDLKADSKKLLDVTELLQGKDYVCLEPRRYVFQGAELSESTDSEWEGDDEEEDDDNDEDYRADDYEAESSDVNKFKECLPRVGGEGSEVEDKSHPNGND